jgi:hypothetical protein
LGDPLLGDYCITSSDHGSRYEALLLSASARGKFGRFGTSISPLSFSNEVTQLVGVHSSRR